MLKITSIIFTFIYLTLGCQSSLATVKENLVKYETIFNQPRFNPNKLFETAETEKIEFQLQILGAPGAEAAYTSDTGEVKSLVKGSSYNINSGEFKLKRGSSALVSFTFGGNKYYLEILAFNRDTIPLDPKKFATWLKKSRTHQLVDLKEINMDINIAFEKGQNLLNSVELPSSVCGSIFPPPI